MDEKQFIIEKVLSSKSDLKQREVVDFLGQIRHETVSQPVVYIGSGTCGKVAGADETFAAVTRYLTEKNIRAEIIQVGCIGLCSYEPIVDIQLPGKARISFRNITHALVDLSYPDYYRCHLLQRNKWLPLEQEK